MNAPNIESAPVLATGFEAFNGLIGNAEKSLEKLKSKGMEEYGLSGTYTLCLRQLYDNDGGWTRTELARRCGVDRAQITRVIGELIAKNLVQEIGCGANYRKKCILTEQGRAVTAEVNETVSRMTRLVSGDIPKERLAVFYETLTEICEKLQQAVELLEKGDSAQG